MTYFVIDVKIRRIMDNSLKKGFLDVVNVRSVDVFIHVDNDIEEVVTYQILKTKLLKGSSEN